MSSFGDRGLPLNLPPLEPSSVRLILLIGLPGSGKSTIASRLLQANPQRQVISTDAIRLRLFGNEAIQGHWLKVWQEVGRQFQQAVEQQTAGQALETIYDATNVVRRDRRRVIALARTCGFEDITGVWLNTPLDLCLQRNRQRDRQVPDAIILRMHRCLMGAPPSMSDGCDRLIKVGS